MAKGGTLARDGHRTRDVAEGHHDDRAAGLGLADDHVFGGVGLEECHKRDHPSS